jgi:glycosyltransferase involved in cell wall biosynthesis
MRIVQINTADVAGGAEAVASQLMQSYRRAGHASWMAVGQKNGHDSDVYVITHDPYRTRWSRWSLAIADRFATRMGTGRIARRIHRLIGIGLGQPRRLFRLWQGKEDFDFPGTDHLGAILPQLPEVIHCHNLHGSWLPGGGYFDLSALARYSRIAPVVVTLHDAWMLSGHCAHSFECDRWKTGCGECPDLTIYPAIYRDATAYNWERKQETYASSRLYVATPSRWLMRKVEASMLRSAIVGSKIIPNGVDLSVFHPANKSAVRGALGIPRHARVLLFAAHGIRENIWKDYATLRKAVEEIAAKTTGREVLFIALGEEGDCEKVGGVTIRFVPHQRDRTKVAQYYQAADVYLHAARADTFPNSILEALACGVPVVATSVGGIPEQIEQGKTGFLVPSGDASGIAERVISLLVQDSLRAHCGQEARQTAQTRFNLDNQVNAYLEWYEEILRSWKAGAGEHSETASHPCEPDHDRNVLV